MREWGARCSNVYANGISMRIDAKRHGESRERPMICSWRGGAKGEAQVRKGRNRHALPSVPGTVCRIGNGCVAQAPERLIGNLRKCLS